MDKAKAERIRKILEKDIDWALARERGCPARE